MGRPKLGKAVRDRVLAVRVTEAEEAELIRKYGSGSKALRALINAEKARTKDTQS